MDLDDWRVAIDEIDEQLVVLLNRRAQCAIEAGRVKRALGVEIYQPKRETEVLRHVTSCNHGPLDEAAIRHLFERIIDESRRVERIIVDQEESTQEAPRGKQAE